VSQHDPGRDDPGQDDLAAVVGRRLGRYVELWDSANAKLSTGTYHADDLVDDWFRWVGLVAQDATAAAALIWRAASGADADRTSQAPDGGSSPG
jgi:hypothetical protein